MMFSTSDLGSTAFKTVSYAFSSTTYNNKVSYKAILKVESLDYIL